MGLTHPPTHPILSTTLALGKGHWRGIDASYIIRALVVAVVQQSLIRCGWQIRTFNNSKQQKQKGERARLCVSLLPLIESLPMIYLEFLKCNQDFVPELKPLFLA